MDDPEVVRLHRQWNNADYALYDRANQTFWRTIESLGSDFWDEVHLYEEYNSQVAEYCGPIIKQLSREPAVIYNLYKEMKPLEIPASKWGEAVTIDPCLVRGRSNRHHAVLQCIQSETVSSDMQIFKSRPRPTTSYVSNQRSKANCFHGTGLLCGKQRKDNDTTGRISYEGNLLMVLSSRL